MKSEWALSLVVLNGLLSYTSAAVGCPGASAAASLPGLEKCDPPICTNEIWSKNTLFPHRDATKFYQCGPGLNYYEMPCAPGTCFSPGKQVCVHVYNWKNPCADEIVATTQATTITTPQTTEPTTQETTEPTTQETTQETTEFTTQETTEPTTQETTQETTEPTTQETTQESTEPTTQETTQETTEFTTPETTEPTTQETTQETTEPTTQETTQETTQPTTTRTPFYGQICPGVDRDTVEPGEYDCAPPACNKELYESKAKWPDVEPNYWYTCFSEQTWVRSKCATGRCYSVLANACVVPSQWVNACAA